MDTLNDQSRHGDDNAIECWDDDGDFQCIDDIQLFTASTTNTSLTNPSIRPSGHRDSISSRRSARSADLDSIPGGDDDWQVLVHDHDELTTEATFPSAKNAGVPIPENVPKSALTGGTIKRLGQRKTKDFVDDWSEDVVFPSSDTPLKLKTPQESTFPDLLHTVDSTTTSPVKASASSFWKDDIPVRPQPALPSALNNFREQNDCDRDILTIKDTKDGSPQQKAVPFSNFSQQNDDHGAENFDKDFDLPTDDLRLRLPSYRDTLKVSNPTTEDIDLDWTEGSIGVRFGGTGRDYRSDPSSSVSVLSPSVSSCLTGASEDDQLDGLVIPEGPLNLETSLKKRQNAELPPPVNLPEKCTVDQAPNEKDNFFSGIDIDDVDVFGPKKPAANPNIRYKTERPGSSVRPSTTTFTAADAAVSPGSRIPRLSGHERSFSTQLETVSESGEPIARLQKFQNQPKGNSLQSSASSLSPYSASAVPATPASYLAKPGRHTGPRSSGGTSIDEHISADNPPLRTKLSMPAMRHVRQAAPASPSQSSIPRRNGPSLSFSSARLKAPADRSGNDARLGRKPSIPFIPAGASESQSHHVGVKTPWQSRRTNSDGSVDMANPQGSIPRTPRFGSEEPFGNTSSEMRPGNLFATAKHPLTKPTRKRNFGDGTELESFDDLPTSVSAESRFVRHPTGRGAPRSLRSKLGRNQRTPLQTESPTQQAGQVSPPKRQNLVPRFARDTAASRSAREQRTASLANSARDREANLLVSLNSNWKGNSASRQQPNSTPSKRKREKSAALPPKSKPHLIKPLGSGVHESKGELVLFWY